MRPRPNCRKVSRKMLMNLLIEFTKLIGLGPLHYGMDPETWFDAVESPCRSVENTRKL